jgi:uncharacterized protein
MTRIWIDADATPKKIKELLYRAAQRRRIPMTFVANQFLNTPRVATIKVVVVAKGFDKAEDFIAENCTKGDLIITADIPLAARCIEQNALVVTPRGRIFDANNIGPILSARNFNEEVRNAGLSTKGPDPITNKNIQQFANALDSWISKRK